MACGNLAIWDWVCRVDVSLLAPVREWELVARLGVALLAGGLLGVEREVRRKSAGVRTYMLVSLGAAFFVLIPIQLGILQQNGEGLSRVMQGIITGVGFVGGGVILHQSSRQSEGAAVHGMTSAAAIWMTAALGIAAGCGLWQLALLGGVIAFLILDTLKRWEKTL